MKPKPPRDDKDVPAPTPGCSCSHCRRLKELQANGAPDGRKNMGRVQFAAREQGWADGGVDENRDLMFGHLRGNEQADREEREALGRCLPAAYRYLLGPALNVRAGDVETARRYLSNIKKALELGGWTRSEWTRLYKMRDKWKARVDGTDARFKEVGNRRGGVTKQEGGHIKQRRIISEMMDALSERCNDQGD